MATLGEQLVQGLEAYGVDTVFGIPGVHTVELYRGLAASTLRHVTPRHEQGAGFMADGYYRANGRIAAAFVITGPGLTNILTPMAQAYADSIPMLVVSSVGSLSRRGMGGDLHEIRNQGLIAAQAAAFSHTITHPAQLPKLLSRAWGVFHGARPRPVHIEVPVDLLAEDAAGGGPWKPAVPAPPVASQNTIDAAARHLWQARAPLVLAGGGSIRSDGGEAVRGLAERLGAPLVTTANARGAVPADHPLSVPASPSLCAVRDLVAASDCVLAVGTEIGRTDFDLYGGTDFEVEGTFIRIDIDPDRMQSGPSMDVSLVGDAAAGAAGLIRALDALAVIEGGKSTFPLADGPARAAAVRNAALEEIGPKHRTIVSFVETIRDALPAAPIVCDSTQAAYAGNLYHAAPAPFRWFNAATGYGALGYGLPAAIGAAQALRRGKAGQSGATEWNETVVCIAGDGGLQFTLSELGCAVEEGLPVILLVWNNRGYGEIKDYMISRQITPVGVDLLTPDFLGIARAYGASACSLERIDDLPALLGSAAARRGPTVIEIDERLVLGG